jgi:hypothetical protein
VVKILRLIALQIRAEIEQGLWQQLFDAQQEGNEQSSKSAVAVNERVDCLELVVNEGEADQRG